MDKFRREHDITRQIEVFGAPLRKLANNPRLSVTDHGRAVARGGKALSNFCHHLHQRNYQALHNAGRIKHDPA